VIVAKPYDATTRDLIELDPPAWVKYLRIRVSGRSRIEAIDADLSTINAQADKVLRVTGKHPHLIHIELQAARDARMAERLLRYNVLLGHRHRVSVRSVLVLLRPKAWSPRLTGFHEMMLPGGDAYLRFRYDVVKAWEQRAEDVLRGGLATLPLVAISDVGSMGIAEALTAMAERLAREASPDRRAMLLNSAWVLLGLGYGEDEAREIWKGIEMDVLKIRGIEQSSTYQEILKKGRRQGKVEGKAEEARQILLRQGRKKLGNPPKTVRNRIEAMNDLAQLNDLLDRILDVASWDELLTK
jgi:predicted transposase YdaD